MNKIKKFIAPVITAVFAVIAFISVFLSAAILTITVGNTAKSSEVTFQDMLAAKENILFKFNFAVIIIAIVVITALVAILITNLFIKNQKVNKILRYTGVGLSLSTLVLSILAMVFAIAGCIDLSKSVGDLVVSTYMPGTAQWLILVGGLGTSIAGLFACRKPKRAEVAAPKKAAAIAPAKTAATPAKKATAPAAKKAATSTAKKTTTTKKATSTTAKKTAAKK